MHRNLHVVLWKCLLIFHWISSAQAFSWSGNLGASDVERGFRDGVLNPSLEHQSRLPNIYAVAMQELQDLESEPLCHRIAARLLVNNCQLLDGKDDATVLIDSGRQIRDFVDSYAASLAICDLERGSFVIPSGCSPFREASLAKIPESKLPRLHVIPQQIDSCLSGLAKSDSAWNTWVSYRHKALRFCEAARSDHEKAQSIRLHQRLTEVLSKLSEGVEQELESRFHKINERATEASEHLRSIVPDIDKLRHSLQEIDRTLSQDVMELAQSSQDAMRSGLDDAQNLKQLLAVLLKTVLSGNAEVAASHEVALTTVKDHTNSEVAIVMAALSSVASSSISLQEQMELSHFRFSELAGRQVHLENGLEKLFALVEDLSSRYEMHHEKLTMAQQLSDDLLETLDDMAVSAHNVHGSLSTRSRWMSWWPYIICPTASLLMGSYGLPPSAIRNLGLIALGQFAGLVVSYTRYFTPVIWDYSQTEMSSLSEANSTLYFASVDTHGFRNFSADLRH